MKTAICIVAGGLTGVAIICTVNALASKSTAVASFRKAIKLG